jgi:hypothetical protein
MKYTFEADMIKSTAIIVLSFLFCNLNAQNSFNSGGFDASGSGGSVSASIGQLVNNQYSGSTGIIQEGVQLPFELISLKQKKAVVDSYLWDVYPNPSSNSVYINTQNIKATNISISLFDNTGKLLLKENTRADNTSLNLSSFSAGIYLLKIHSGSTLLGSTQIIKNN